MTHQPFRASRRDRLAFNFFVALGCFIAFVVLMLPLAAFAQTAEAAPGPTAGQRMLELLMSPAGMGIVGGIVTAVLGLFGFNTASAVNERRRLRVAQGASIAFHVVEDIGAMIDGEDGFDKVARGLKEVDAWFVANGWRPLKPGEQERVKAQFQAMNGASKLAEKVGAAVAVEGIKAALGSSSAEAVTPPEGTAQPGSAGNP